MAAVAVDQEVLQGVAATLEWINLDGDGEPVATSGAVAAVVTRADGTVLQTSTAATADTDETGRYTVALPAAKTVDLDLLTVTWTDAGDSSVHTTTVEIVGGFYFNMAEATAWHTSLSSLANGDGPAKFRRIRREVVNELEDICDRSFVPRYRRLTLNGGNDTTIGVGCWDLRTVEALTVDGTAWTDDQVAAVQLAGRSLLLADDVWPWGFGNIVVAITHGWDRPPPRLKRAMLDRFRQLHNADKSGIPERAKSYHADQGGTFELDRASRYRTGYPDIDAVYERYSARSLDGQQAAPAIAQLDLNPQWGSLFHGGRR